MSTPLDKLKLKQKQLEARIQKLEASEKTKQGYAVDSTNHYM